MTNKKQKKKPGNIWRLLAYIKPYWLYFAAATAFGLVKFLVPVQIARLVGEAINVLNAVNAGKITEAAAWAQIKHFFVIGLAMVSVLPFACYMRTAFAARAVQEVIRNLRCDLYAHIQKLSHSFFDSHRSGALTSRLIGDVQAIQPFIGKAFVQVWMSVGLIAYVLYYFFSHSVYLGIISVILLPLQAIVQRKIGWKVKENARTIRDRLAYLSGSTQEKLAAATIVKAFTSEDDEVQRFSDDSTALVDLGVRNSRLTGLNEASMGFVKMMARLVVILFGGYLALHQSGSVSIGLLVQFVMMQEQLYGPFEWLNEMQLVMANAMGASERVFNILDIEPEIADKPGAVIAPHFEGEIKLEHIAFAYPGSNHRIFENLNLVVPARTTLALVGPSGGGKTTVTNLLNRFYEWEEGRIFIDGRDICDYTVYSLRHQIGLVPQEPILFSGTIEDNILYGRPDATFEEVQEAAHRAYAADFIAEMEDGYDTMLGERGVRLSGGQKQRISIARAFLKDPAIIVLDEATSALDSESERIVQQALEELMHDRTTLVIAHRLATIRNADQIAVIGEGGVMELGTHDELLNLGGTYARLCEQQFDLPSDLLGSFSRV